MAKVEIAPEMFAAVKEIAKEKEISNDEAADYLINVAVGRLSAVRRDAKRRAAGKPAQHRKVTVISLDAKKEKPAKGKAKKVKAAPAKAKKAPSKKAQKVEEPAAA